MSIAKVVSGVLALGLYVAASATWAAEGPHTYSADDVAAGKAVYTGTCIACHGANGKGLLPGTPDSPSPAVCLACPTRCWRTVSSTASAPAMPPCRPTAAMPA
ncbi:MAG: c-type cytochrome [Xanthomonadaceae bacterium]|nr:c-type cytochrome [Xanthomonadaceae bacterium]